MEQSYNNWQLATDNDNILWLYFDKQDSSVNTLDRQSLMELEVIIESLMGDTAYKGLVIASKKKGFIAGADINVFLALREKQASFEFMRDVQKIYDKLEHLKIPTVALIKGHCLGGGLELALACRYRIAVESDKKEIGFPEILLGIFPGWGGTVRATRLIGLAKALPLILQGSLLRPGQMKKLGLIDAVQPERHVEAAARSYVLGQVSVRRCKHHFSNTWLMKKIIAHKARQQLKEKNIHREHYPALYAAIDYLSRARINSIDAFVDEADAVATLTETKTTENLVRLFFLRDRLKKLTKTADMDVRHVHVVGAGTMGADIAAWCVSQGLIVTLQDKEPSFIAKAFKRIYAGISSQVKCPIKIRDTLDRLIPDPTGRGVAGADIIIEAIIEDLAIKQALFRDVETNAKPTALFATNTSSIPIELIASVLKSPERLIGLHFFNPVAKMQLIEVISHPANDESIKHKALHFVGQLAKLPVPMNSGPGFVVNRILMPYLMAAFQLYEEGLSPVAIDKLATDFGMPMGPVTLADMVGLDVCLHIVEMVGHQLSLTAPEKLKDMVAAGQLGVKTNRGFYRYKNGKVKKPRTPTTISNQAALTDRLIMPMVKEAQHCLTAGIVTDADLIDAAMVFGAGFAPFRGGPMQYAKSRNFS